MVMVVKIIFIIIFIFIFLLIFSNAITKLLQFFLWNTGYKLTKKSLYFISTIIMVLLGILLGNIVMYKLV